MQDSTRTFLAQEIKPTRPVSAATRRRALATARAQALVQIEQARQDGDVELFGYSLLLLERLEAEASE